MTDLIKVIGDVFKEIATIAGVSTAILLLVVGGLVYFIIRLFKHYENKLNEKDRQIEEIINSFETKLNEKDDQIKENERKIDRLKDCFSDLLIISKINIRTKRVVDELDRIALKVKEL